MAYLLGSSFGAAPGTAPSKFDPSESWQPSQPFSMVDGEAGKYAFDGAEVVVRTAGGGGAPGRKAAASRAGTAAQPSRAATAAASSHGSAFNVVVIAENRAREIGVAICNLRAQHTIELVQFTDNHSYSQTLALLDVLSPVEIVLSKAQIERVLSRKIIDYWGSEANVIGTQISAMHRRSFDEARGLECAQALSAETLSPDLQSRYLALGSLAALLQYLQQIQQMGLAARTLRFVWREPRGRMSLDYETIKSLELLVNARTGDHKASLFGILNHTRTSVGTRLLRANILSPCNDLPTLNARLDAVAALLGAEETYAALGDVLPRLADLDALLSFFVSTPRVHSPATARQAVAAVLRLRQTLALLPQVAEALIPELCGHSILLARVRETLASPALGGQQAAINAALSDDAGVVRSPSQRAVQECFSVRPGTDGHLDAMRRIYVDTMAEIGEVVERYRLEWGIPSLKLHFTLSRGHHLQLPSSAEVTGLPPGLVQAVKVKTTIAASTDELISLNERAKESVIKMYRCTHLVLQGLISAIRAEIPSLFRVVESIALLDMLRAFAVVVAEAPNPTAFVRPTFTLAGPLCILGGRHPVVERTRAPGSFVPNDVYLGPGANFQILTGPNCSGKTTFLKQTAVLVILAHLGCFVPAASASMRLTDRICTHLSTGDDIETNASTFLKEMKEAAFILAHASEGTLVVIDELGRATSNSDGVGIAWAFAESLAHVGAYAILATHYHELAELSRLYPNVRNCSMAVEVVPPTAVDGAASTEQGGLIGPSALRFRYTLSSGSTPHTSDYGIALAQLSGLPSSFIADAQAIKASIVARADDPARPLTSLRRHAAAPTSMHDGGEAESTEVHLRHVECTALLRVSADLATRLAPLYIEVQTQVQAAKANAAAARAAGASAGKAGVSLPYEAMTTTLSIARGDFADALSAVGLDGSGRFRAALAAELQFRLAARLTTDATGLRLVRSTEPARIAAPASRPLQSSLLDRDERSDPKRHRPCGASFSTAADGDITAARTNLPNVPVQQFEGGKSANPQHRVFTGSQTDQHTRRVWDGQDDAEPEVPSAIGPALLPSQRHSQPTPLRILAPLCPELTEAASGQLESGNTPPDVPRQRYSTRNPFQSPAPHGPMRERRVGTEERSELLADTAVCYQSPEPQSSSAPPLGSGTACRAIMSDVADGIGEAIASMHPVQLPPTVPRPLTAPSLWPILDPSAARLAFDVRARDNAPVVGNFGTIAGETAAFGLQAAVNAQPKVAAHTGISAVADVPNVNALGPQMSADWVRALDGLL